MLGCTDTVTVVRAAYDAAADLDIYLCQVIEGVSWFGKSEVRLEEKGLVGATRFRVRIPAGRMPESGITEGDTLVHGAVEGIKKQADLKGTEHFLVKSVGDNRRGRLAHWVVSNV